MSPSPFASFTDRLAALTRTIGTRVSGRPIRDDEEQIDPEEAAQLIQDMEAAIPVIQRRKARLAEMRANLSDGAGFIDAYAQELMPLARGVRLAAMNFWVGLIDQDPWSDALDADDLMSLLGIYLVWSLAAAERALSRTSISATGLQPLLWELLLQETSTSLREQGLEARLDQVRAAGESALILYPTALDEPAFQNEPQTTELVQRSCALLEDQGEVQNDLVTALDREWWKVDMAMPVVVHRVLGEALEGARMVTTLHHLPMDHS